MLNATADFGFVLLSLALTVMSLNSEAVDLVCLPYPESHDANVYVVRDEPYITTRVKSILNHKP